VPSVAAVYPQTGLGEVEDISGATPRVRKPRSPSAKPSSTS